MKKWIGFAFVVLVLLGVSACSKNAREMSTYDEKILVSEQPGSKGEESTSVNTDTTNMGSENAVDESNEIDQTETMIETLQNIETMAPLEEEPAYEIKSIDSFYNGYARIVTSTGYGYMNTKGEVVIEPIYDSASLIFDDLALVSLNGTKQMINRDGKAVYTASGKETAIGEFSNGYFWTETQKKTIGGNIPTMTYYDKNGEVAFELENVAHAYYNVALKNGAIKEVSMSGFNEYGYAVVAIPTTQSRTVFNLYFRDDYVQQIIDTSGKIKKWSDNYSIDEMYGAYALMYTPDEGFSHVRLNYHEMGVGYSFEGKWIPSKMYPISDARVDYLGNDCYAEYTSGYVYTRGYLGSVDYNVRTYKYFYWGRTRYNLSNIDEFEGASVKAIKILEANTTTLVIGMRLQSKDGVEFSTIVDIANEEITLQPTTEIELFFDQNSEKLVLENLSSDRQNRSHTDLYVAKDKTNGKYGYIDKNGEWIISPRYNTAGVFCENNGVIVAVVDNNTIIDCEGNVVYQIEK